MQDHHKIAVIIPALNEAQSIAKVLGDIPEWVDDIVVADNGSTDGTPEIATGAGARVVNATQRGYGSACLAGIAALHNPDVVVFLDGDYSDYPEDMKKLVSPILDGQADLVIGSRVLGTCEPGALTPQQRFGNGLACWLMRLFWGTRFTDLGPFRAVRYDSLVRLGMCDPNYGWTVEMQIKAARGGLRCVEVPVRYRKRIGKSKVSGTIRGVVGAGTKILYTVFRAALNRNPVNERIVLFSRFPVPGETKTRLIPALGAEGAADVQRRMTEHIIQVLDTLAPQLEVRYTGGRSKDMASWLGADRRYVDQGDGDLGDRMMRAVNDAFAVGIDRIVLVGSDCPALNQPILTDAFDRLHTDDVVIGPAHDCGYYLIGLRRSANYASLFENIAWGTDTVLETTLERACRLNLRVGQLPHLKDVDRPEDLDEVSRFLSN